MYFLAMTAALLAWPDDAVKLGSGETWFEQEKAAVQTIEGILDYQPGSGRIGTPANFVPFRLVRKDQETGKVLHHVIHAPGHETRLAVHVGQLVQVQAKLVKSEQGETLWAGTLKALGPAPLHAFTELKPLARTNRFHPTMAQLSSEAARLVLRSGQDAAKSLGYTSDMVDGERVATEVLARNFGVKTIDWKNQMVIYVGNAYQSRITLKKIEITKLEVDERGVTVHWKQEEGRPVNSPYVTDTILVPRVDGAVNFKQEKTPGSGDEKKLEPEPARTLPVIPQAPVK